MSNKTESIIADIMTLDSHYEIEQVIQAIKHAHDILGDLNFDYNSKGIKVFRSMDQDGDLRINKKEFVKACLEDQDLGQLMEQLMSSPELFQK